MFRRPRETGPSVPVQELGRILEPLPTLPWGPLALEYLGVPIVVGVHHIAVQDDDYQNAIQKLLDANFVPTVPNRNPPPEVMDCLPDPQSVLAEINEGYKTLDQASETFNYPNGHPEREEQVILIPNSFAHLPLDQGSVPSSIQPTQRDLTTLYDVYNNALYPLERALVESFVQATIRDEKDTGISKWGEVLRSWLSMMVGYLEVEHDVLDSCEDQRAVEWFSTHFGRVHEATSGSIDRRITKRIGSGKELPVDMRGHPVVYD